MKQYLMKNNTKTLINQPPFFSAIFFILTGFFISWGSMYTGSTLAASSSISGTAYQDMNRDGEQQADEESFEGHVIYLFDSNGDLVGVDETDVDGRYSFSNLSNDDYRVSYMPRTWSDIRSDWAPTTTGTLYPEHEITLSSGEATADFGWRPITWSDELAEPISELVGDEGLTVQSYNDAVTAQEVYDYIVDNFRVDGEAPTTTVRFAYGSLNQAQTTTSYSSGAITGVRTVAYASYERMLGRGGHRTLAHEYGHAWMNYHNHYIQQDVDREWLTFLEARGIDADDDRLGSSHQWQPSEIAAEDYRQLLTTEPTSSGNHMNRDVIDAWDVEGFRGFITGEFMQPVPHHPHYDDLVDDDDSSDPEPEKPTASFNSACDGPVCEFIDDSTAGDASISSYDWDLGDGNTATGETVSHTYSNDGSYQVTLTVTDQDGLEDSATETVDVSSDTESPTTPENLQARAMGIDQVSLSWEASSDNVGVSGYRIYRNGNQVDTTKDTSYSDTNLNPGTEYSYYVRAYDAAGNLSQPSETATVTTDSTSLGSVSGVVTSTNSSNLEGVSVSIGRGNKAVTYTTDANGYYKVPQLSSGSHELRFEARHHGNERETVTINGNDIELNVTLEARGPARR